MRLIVIPISHYCERARWALDWARLPYTEERHLQLFSRISVRRAGGRGTTPVLITDTGEALPDSKDIVGFAHDHGDRPLYPNEPSLRAEVESLEAKHAGRFGIETRRLAYAVMAPHKELLLRYNNQGAPGYQKAMLRYGYRPAMAFVKRALKVTDDRVARGRVTIEETFADVAERLSDGRRYLFGDAFTAADLTFASLAAPVVLPREYGVTLPTADEFGPDIRAMLDHFRSLPAGEFALRVYSDHRRGH